MSLELIKEYNIYHHIIDFADTDHLYKPFNEISDSDPEGEIGNAIGQGYKILIKGSTGSGKSSIVNYVIRNIDKNYLPISCNIIGYGGSTLDNPADFAKFILDRVINNVKLSKELKDKVEEIDEFNKYVSKEISFTDGKKHKQIVRLKNRFSWIPSFIESNFEVGEEIEKYTETVMKKSIYAQDPIDSINTIVHICAEKKITPIFILDDTDKFLRKAGFDNTKPINLFFSNIAPILNHIQCPVIFPAHNYYDEFPIYYEYEKNEINSVINVPVIGTLKDLTALLDKKVKAIDNDFEIERYFGKDALGMLFSNYLNNSEDGLRGVMTCITRAVDTAISLGKVQIDTNIMKHAIVY